jgi:hypothetical protein
MVLEEGKEDEEGTREVNELFGERKGRTVAGVGR